MRFVALAVAFVPDLVTARRGGGLDGLDDASIAKILFHQAQQSGGEQGLRWDQVSTATISLLRHDPANTEVTGLSTAGTPENVMLDQLCDRLAGSHSAVMWDPHGRDLAALRYRSTCLNSPQSLLWRADGVTELAALYGGPMIERPTLDDLARGMGLPVPSAEPGGEPLDAWLSGDPRPLLAATRRAAVNLYVLALRAFHVSGALTHAEMQGGLSRLRQWSDTQVDGAYPGLSAALVELLAEPD
jgi:hypothetical protein